MTLRRVLFDTTSSQSFIWGTAVAVSLILMRADVAGAAVVFQVCAIGAAFGWIVTRRQKYRAIEKINSAGTSLSDSRSCGLFGDVVAAAQHQLADSRLKLQQSQRKQTEFEAKIHLRDKQIRHLEAALRSLDEPIVITDFQGQLKFCNDAAIDVLTAKDSVDGDSQGSGDRNGHRSELPRLESIPELKVLLEESRNRDNAVERRTTEFELAHAGATTVYRATATTLLDETGALSGTVVVLKDVQAERQQKSRHAEFVASVCHELKTPMSSIKAFTEMLIDGDIEDESEKQESYGFIESQVDRLTRMVNSMLNLARIESGVIQVQREDCELNDVLNKALRVVQPTADEKNIRVVSELSDLYMAAHIDRDLLGQAVINLLSNAVKYTPAGGEIRLRSRIEETRAVIEVRDTGMGIPDDSLPHIFERFYRVPENNKAASGTGLGLALVHYIVTELHNGEVRVESTVGEGTTFSLSLPLGHQKQNRLARESGLCTV
ncbi:MAG: hypothetical protein IID45_11265 [Planctomycetes bacterium]|nr:hypothetical protein [Planctomycetota bacterium]